MKKTTLLMLLIVATIFSYAQNVTKKYTFQHEGASLSYHDIKPKGTSKKYPLVIMLHGIGSRGNSNITKEFNKPKTFFTPFINQLNGDYAAHIIIPQCTSNDYWSSGMEKQGNNYSYNSEKGKTPTTSMKTLMALINSIIASEEIDTQQIYIVGVSMGGFGSYELLWRMPSKTFAGALILCGDTDASFEKISHFTPHTPVWIFHGYKDTTVKVGTSQKIFQAIRQIITGHISRYSEYSIYGHDCWTYTLSKKTEIVPWLFGYRSIETGYYKISIPQQNQVITKSGNSLLIDSFHASKSQEWILKPSANNSSSYYIYSADGEGKYLSVDSKTGKIQFKKITTPTKNEYWKLIKASKNTHYIQSTITGTRLQLLNNQFLLSAEKGNEWEFIPSKLFLLGGATTAKWDVTKSLEMAPDTQRNGVFTWIGTLEASDFKFITTSMNNKYSSYTALTKDERPVFGKIHELDPTSTNYNYKYKLAQKGLYKLTVDLVNKTMKIDNALTIENLYMTGTAFINSNDKTNPIETIKNESKYNCFIWEGELKKGTFKFILNKRSWNGSINPLSNQSVTNGTSYRVKHTNGVSGDYKFSIKKAGNYIITADLNTMTATITEKASMVKHSFSVDEKNNNVEQTVQKGIENDINHQVNILNRNGYIEITTNNTNIVNIATLYNLNGNIVDRVQNKKAPLTLGKNINSGIYIVEIQQQGETHRKKIMIK